MSRGASALAALCLFSILGGDAATAAKIRGLYPVGNWLSPNRNMLKYESPEGATIVEYKIYSDLESIVWKNSEARFEDSTISSIEGPRGALFSIETGGEDWGYSNQNGLSIFFLDYSSFIGIQSDSQKYNQFQYEYDALVLNNKKIKAYHCSFSVSRLRDARSEALLRKPYKSSDVIFARIGQFLANNGVDPQLDKCEEKPELLNASIVALAEQDMKEIAEARSNFQKGE